MAKIEIYTWSTCPFCRRAKTLLEKKGVDFTEYDISGKDDERTQMIERTGGPKSVPQIFIDGKHVGGSDDLLDLDAKGELDPMIGT